MVRPASSSVRATSWTPRSISSSQASPIQASASRRSPNGSDRPAFSPPASRYSHRKLTSTERTAGDEHPWEWLAGLLHVHGVEATAGDLRHLPYEVVFSERLRARVASA